MTPKSGSGQRRAIAATIVFAPVALALTLAAGGSSRAARERLVQRDRDELVAVEQQWLAGEHDRATLEQILADDFLHPVSAGVFLTKAEHIDWAVAHRPAADVRQAFDHLRVRTYGDVGIVTGIVVSSASDGRQSRTVFTDVFVRRDGRWQAVNAQENGVEDRR